MSSNGEHWSTAAEVEFIRGLGTHRLERNTGRGGPDKKGLLDGYIKGAMKRTRWGNIDSATVTLTAIKERENLS